MFVGRSFVRAIVLQSGDGSARTPLGLSKPAVLVTGGAQRIGAQIARVFGAAGWQVIVHYHRSANAARALAAELPDALAIECDLADMDAVEAMVRALARQHPQWRVLVNCAAVFEPDDAAAMEPKVFARAMGVNAQAPVVLAQSFLRHALPLGERRVVQVTDQKLANPNPDFFSYSMSKHALGSTIAMLAMGAARPGDRVYGLAPGAILASHDQSESEADASHRMNLLRRRTNADEVAEACLFLAEGWLSSGETLFVDSGQHLLAQPRDVIYLARGSGHQ